MKGFNCTSPPTAHPPSARPDLQVSAALKPAQLLDCPMELSGRGGEVGHWYTIM